MLMVEQLKSKFRRIRTTPLRRSHIFTRQVIHASFIMFLVNLLIFTPSFALLQSPDREIYAINDIKFYDGTAKNCISASTNGSRGNSDGSDVYIIGDSITVQSQAQILSQFPDLSSSSIDAISGTYFSRNSDFGPGGTERISNMGNQPILVFAMGSNGGINYVDRDDTQKLLNALSGKNVKVILMTIYYNNYSIDQMNSSNDVVKTLSANNANITYFDWYSVASSNPAQYISSDGVHPTSAGQAKFAELIKDAVDNVTSMSRSNTSTTNSSSNLSQTQLSFVTTYHDIAASLSIQYGIPWETVMAQGILESASGTSFYATDRNNFFGIGAFDSNPDNAFSYPTPEDGWKGYYENIRKTSVYRNAGVFSGDTVTDPYAYLAAIKQAGYATDPNYVSKVSTIIRSIETLSAEQGWASSAQLARANPVWYENAATNAQGAGASSAVTYSPVSGYATYCSDNGSNGGDGSTNSGGVTTTDIGNYEYAFPIAGATQENYLQNKSGNSIFETYSKTDHNCLGSNQPAFRWVTCLSTPTSWYHHTNSSVSYSYSGTNERPSADMAIAYPAVSGGSFQDSNYYASRYGFPTTYTDTRYYLSSGAKVVATIGGTLHVLNNHRNGYANCGDMYIVGDDGHIWNYIHTLYDDNLYSSETRRVERGEVIGEIGTPQCADGTQSHLHFMIDSHASTIDIADYLNPLFNALPANAAALAERESAKQTTSTQPIAPLSASSVDIACATGTNDLGIESLAYFNGTQTPIRLCAIPNIRQSSNSDGYIHVNSRVSGAYFALGQRYYQQNGTYLTATQSFRSMAQQEYFWNCYQTKACNNGNVAAQPGYSNHQGGLAVDFNVGDWNSSISVWFTSNLSAFGLARSVPSEAWHVSPSGT